MSRSYIFPMMFLLFTFSIISFFLIAVPYANAGGGGPCTDFDCQQSTFICEGEECCVSGNCPDGTSCIWNGIDDTVGECTNPQAESGCEATIKCVCEGPFHTRGVDCPTDVELPFLYPGHGPRGTLGVDCSHGLTHNSTSLAFCEDLSFKCKWWYGEHRNCLLTLPLFVAPGGPVQECVQAAEDDTTCDGMDDDCDGSVDEDYLSLPTVCGVGICLREGQISCVDGSEMNSCTPGIPEIEGPGEGVTCLDGVDNDCDNLTDAADPNCQG